MNYDNTAGSRAMQMDAHERELQDVFVERLRQLRKFGPQNRPPHQWFLILSEEVGEVAKECVEIEFDDAAHPHADPERYYKGLTEVAAVALAAMQNFNQRRPRPAPRPAPGPTPTKEVLAAALVARYGQPTVGSTITAEDIISVMPLGPDSPLNFQAHISGFTDWYTVTLDSAGNPDPATIDQLPF